MPSDTSIVNPDVTILCSNYNSSRWIDGYCRSLNQQLLPKFSIIFVDACSTDGSVGRFRSFRFREGIDAEVVLCGHRISVYEAWNIAVGKAQTQYCMNVNTDDRLYPSALLTMLSYAAADPEVDVRYSPCFVTRDPEHKRLVDILNWPEFSHAALLQKCICGPFPLLKRNAVVEAGLFNPEYRCSGDYEMWLRMSKQGYRFRKVPEVIGTYYDNPIGLSTSRDLTELRALENAKARALHM